MNALMKASYMVSISIHESPLARTQKAAAEWAITSSFKSNACSAYSYAGDGKPHKTRSRKNMGKSIDKTPFPVQTSKID